MPMISDQCCIYARHFFFFSSNLQTWQLERKNGAISHITITRIERKYWSQNHREQKLAARQPFRFHRPSHCILFLFCANNRWALSSPAVSLRRFSPTGRCHSTLFASVPLCLCLCANVRIAIQSHKAHFLASLPRSNH